MTGFAQLIEWKTSRLDEVEKLNEEWRERFPTMGPTRVLVCGDRDNASSYFTMVEFSSYEEAMKNRRGNVHDHGQRRPCRQARPDFGPSLG